MVLPILVLGIELVLVAVGIGTTAAGIVEGKKANKKMKDEQEESAQRMLVVKIENDLANAPGMLPTS
jgi:hypothetical protein